MKTFFSSYFFSKEKDPITPPFPEEIISEILSKLPVKTLCQFKIVSKPWLSLISDPSFSKLHFNHSIAAQRTALFISAYDHPANNRHFFSVPHGGGGPLTHLITINNAPTVHNKEFTEAEHLNGLILFASGNGFVVNNYAFVINPSTRKMFKLPVRDMKFTYGSLHICYFFGFDESKNEHKVLNIKIYKRSKIEIMMFSLSNYKWRKINADFPVNCDDWFLGTKRSVCVNSVIHVMLQRQILAFDLVNETFSFINLPEDSIPKETRFYNKGFNTVRSNHPFLMKINGLLAVIKRDRVERCGEMDVWILRDYVNRVWVKETVCFSKSWFLLDCPFPLNPTLNKRLVGESPAWKVEIGVPIYDIERRRLEALEYILDDQYSKIIRFDHVRRYVESIFSL